MHQRLANNFISSNSSRSFSVVQALWNYHSLSFIFFFKTLSLKWNTNMWKQLATITVGFTFLSHLYRQEIADTKSMFFHYIWEKLSIKTYPFIMKLISSRTEQKSQTTGRPLSSKPYTANDLKIILMALF